MEKYEIIFLITKRKCNSSVWILNTKNESGKQYEKKFYYISKLHSFVLFGNTRAKGRKSLQAI
jgi:hypothetical protein